MSEQDNVGIVQQAYRNYMDGNLQGVLDLCDDNVEWELPEMEGVPFSGKRRGRDQVEQFFNQLAGAQEALQFEPREFIAQGDKVVTLGHYVWSVRDTDRNFEADWVHVFTVRNGKVAQFKEYTDTAAGQQAYMPREPQ
jgi:ketosteroid isomerase-like protein